MKKLFDYVENTINLKNKIHYEVKFIPTTLIFADFCLTFRALTKILPRL